MGAILLGHQITRSEDHKERKKRQILSCCHQVVLKVSRFWRQLEVCCNPAFLAKTLISSFEFASVFVVWEQLKEQFVVRALVFGIGFGFETLKELDSE